MATVVEITSALSISDIWYNCWSSQEFLTLFALFTASLLLLWLITSTCFKISNEAIGHISSTIHASIVTIISFLILITFSEHDAAQIRQANDDSLPFLFQIFKYVAIFQTAYFFVDAIQLAIGPKSYGYRIAMLVHHTFGAVCACCIYYVHPHIAYVYAIICFFAILVGKCGAINCYISLAVWVL
eukprot:34501_1